MKTSNFTKWAVIFGFVVALAGCGGGGGGSDDDDDDDSGGGGSSVGPSSCDNAGPGAEPSSGNGTETSPYVISLGTDYGGCARGDADPGPIYLVTVPGGTYTVTQTNNTSDTELYIYDEDGNLLFVIDDFIAGFGESGTSPLPAGSYGIEVYSNFDDSPFTLRVD